MAAAGWKPTVDNYLGRVTKPDVYVRAGNDAGGWVERAQFGKISEP